MANREPYTGPAKLVVAFDIGTTYSSISYCILEPGRVPEILGVTRFPAQKDSVPSDAGDAKVPSLLCYDKSGNVRARGAEVLTENAIKVALTEGWTKAEWWKLHLRPKHLASSINPDDDLPPLPPGKSAADVLADFIKYLFECAKTYIQSQHVAFTWSSIEHSVEYIFTHPNGWEGAQQRLYRQAVERAGLIPCTPEGQSRVHLLTDGEANLHVCAQNLLNAEVTSRAAPEGVVIIDAGGGTIDLSMFSVALNPISCEEIAPTECRLQGSVFVTRRAKALLQQRLEGWEHSSPKDIAQFTREFDQITKLTIKSDREPAYIKVGGRRYNNPKYSILSGKLKLSGKEATSLFSDAVDTIVSSFEQQQKYASMPITTAFLVGGLSTNDWLSSRLQSYFNDRNIEIRRLGTYINKAVAKGAVLSHINRDNHPIISRVAPATYGIVCSLPVEASEEEHIRRKLQWEIDPAGDYYVPGYFESKLRKGAHVREMQLREPYALTGSDPTDFGMQTVRILCYRGSLSDPKWVDEDECELLSFLVLSSRSEVDHSASFSPLCTVHADLSETVQDLIMKWDASGQVYYQLNYDVIISFVFTEPRAELYWITQNGEQRRIPATVSCED